MSGIPSSPIPMIRPTGDGGSLDIMQPATEGRFDPISTHNDCGTGNPDEFAIILTTGHVIYTGGFEDEDSLRGCIERNERIAGNFAPRTDQYWDISIALFAVVAIIDLREAIGS